MCAIETLSIFLIKQTVLILHQHENYINIYVKIHATGVKITDIF